jgi:hypothetical protein
MNTAPILKKVQSAEILVLDEDGTTARSEYLNITQQGEILFGEWFAGAPNGVMVVRFKDGTVTSFPLWAPVGQSPSQVGEVAKWQIEGHYVVTNNVIKIIETYARPTAMLVVTDDMVGQDLTIDVLGLVYDKDGKYFDRPVRIIATRYFDNGEVYSVEHGDLVEGAPTVFKGGIGRAGKVRILFEWKNFGQPGKIYTGPTTSSTGTSGGGQKG